MTPEQLKERIEKAAEQAASADTAYGVESGFTKGANFGFRLAISALRERAKMYSGFHCHDEARDTMDDADYLSSLLAGSDGRREGSPSGSQGGGEDGN